MFSKVIVLYGSCHFSGIEFSRSNRAFFGGLSQAERAEEVTRHRKVFEVFREMHEVRRDFQLELYISTCSSVGEEPVRILEDAVAEEKAERGFDDFLSDPLVDFDYSPQ